MDNISYSEKSVASNVSDKCCQRVLVVLASSLRSNESYLLFTWYSTVATFYR